MQKLLDNNVAIITGSASETGIGFATAKMFAEQGCSIAILDLEHTNPDQVAKKLEDEVGNKHCGVVCDVTNFEQCENAVLTVVETLGKINIMVNNAGISQPHRLEDITEEDYDKIMDIHVRACFWFSKLVVPHMKSNKGGAIVNLSSISAIRGGGIFGGSHYSTAKAGIIGMTRALARELGPNQIRVNAVAPSFINTPITKGAIDDERKALLAKDTPLQRVGEPDDVAGVLLFLASGLSSYVTGEVINITGGSHIG